MEVTTMDNVHLGTTVKIGVGCEIKGTTTVKMKDCDFEIFVWSNKTSTSECDVPSTNTLHMVKSDCIKLTDDQYCIEVPTGLIGKGYIVVRIELQVPDVQCASGYRPEIHHSTPNIRVI